MVSRRTTTDDGRRTTDDGRRTTDDGRRTTDDGRPLPLAVLAVVRNLVSALRLLDVASVFADDDRVRIHWTIVPGSEFAEETDEYLARERGIRLKAWGEACRERHDLIIATSGNGELFRLDGPLMLLPHGAGYSRVVGQGNAAPAGLAPEQLLHDGRVLPAVIGLEHEAQRARLAAHCPPAAQRGEVLGDPTRDRLAAGMALRDAYRSALHVAPEQTLAVLSSTWGSGSLFAEHGDLPARLLGELPADEFRLAAIIHPNVAARLGFWEVGRRLSRSRAAGLRLVPSDGWEGAVLAADLVVGDHGSVSMYAAAAGTRVVLGSYDSAQIVPDSPMAALAARLPRLRHESPLAPQLHEALTQDLDGPAYRAAAASMGAPGQSLNLTQATVYDQLGLPAPRRRPKVLAPRPASPDSAFRSAHLVLVERDGLDPAGLGLYVRRFAAAIDPDLVDEDSSGLLCRHLAVQTTDPDPTLRENAEVLLLPERPGYHHVETDAEALEAALARYENCGRVAARAAGPGRCLALSAATGLVELRAADPRIDPAVLASVLWALLLIQGAPEPERAIAPMEKGVALRVGRIRTLVTLQRSAEALPSSPS